MKKILCDKGFCLNTCRHKVYQFNEDSLELMGSRFEHLVKGFGLPSGSTLIEPLEDKEGFTQIFKDEKWVYVEDNRYKDVYIKDTGKKVDITYLGELLPEHTTIKIIPQVISTHDANIAEPINLKSEMERLKSEIIFNGLMGRDITDLQKQYEDIENAIKE